MLPQTAALLEQRAFLQYVLFNCIHLDEGDVCGHGIACMSAQVARLALEPCGNGDPGGLHSGIDLQSVP